MILKNQFYRAIPNDNLYLSKHNFQTELFLYRTISKRYYLQTELLLPRSISKRHYFQISRLIFYIQSNIFFAYDSISLGFIILYFSLTSLKYFPIYSFFIISVDDSNSGISPLVSNQGYSECVNFSNTFPLYQQQCLTTFSIIINSDDVNIVSETSIFDSIGSNLKCLYLK